MSEFIKRLLAPGAKAPRWFTALMVLVLAATGWWYVREAVAHGNRVNARIDRVLTTEGMVFFNGDKEAMGKAHRPPHAYDLNDQRVYMNYAKGLRESHFEMFVTRMRMPMFMYVLSLATDDTKRELDFDSLQAFYAEFFPVARAFNIGLSVVLLVAMFFALRPWLGNWLGVAFTLVAAFQLYILKSPYVQPEVLQTTIITVTVAWIVRALDDPKWWNALIAGLLLCLWHMTKANALVAVGLMGATMGLKLLFAGKGRRLPILIAGPIVLLGYMLPMSPWLYNSWKHFGDPFHNTQSKYYMWATDVHDKHRMQAIGLDRTLGEFDKDGDLTIDNPELMPGPAKYWREHSWDHIKQRFQRGTRMMFVNCFDEYTALHSVQMLWGGILVWAAARRWDETVEAMRRWKFEMIFVVGLLTVFVYLFGWFTPLKVGPRLLNSISLIPIFFCMAGARWLLRQDTMTVRGVPLSTEKLLTLGFLAMWLALTASDLPNDLEIGYFAG